MNQLNSFQTFVTVAEHGSFSRAADELRRSPSSITKTISNLEDELGVMLFQRNTRHTMLTEAGKIYLETARQVISSLKDTAEEVAQLQGEIQGLLRIVSPLAFGRAFLDEACSDFQELHPNICFDVTYTDNPVNMSEGSFDLALRDGTNENLIVRPFGRNILFLCCSPEYLKRATAPILPEFFNLHDWMNFKNPLINRNYWQLEKNGIVQKCPAPQNIKIESNNYDFLLSQALRGRGLLIVPQWYANPLLKNGTLVKVLEEYTLGTDPFGPYLVGAYPQHRRATRKVSSFLDHLEHFLIDKGLS